MRKLNRLLIIAPTLALVVLVLASRPIETSAQTVTATEPTQEEIASRLVRGRAVTIFGLVGLARGQTARLNVVNLRGRNLLPAESPTEVPTEPEVVPIPCRYSLRFINQRGQTIARSIESILSGDGAFLDLAFRNAVPVNFDGRRVQIRAIVRTLLTPEDTGRCASISTLEVFDQETGRTAVIYPEPPR
jgi:hypothetical protein